METELLTFADENPNFESYIVKPGLILSRNLTLRSLASSLAPSVKVDKLATRMLILALEGGEKKIWENSEIGQGLV